ncbi:MAG: CdaR family protein [Myxococcota bacterium]
MARRGSNVRLAFLSVFIAAISWLMAHGSSEIERGFDVPVVFDDVPGQLVVTDQNADAVNIRVLGSRAALRNVNASKLEYTVAVAGAKPGLAVYEVDVSRIDLPSRLKIVSRSPASIEAKFERRGRRSVRVRPDLEGEPAEGFVLGEIGVEPARVWLVGARGDVLRLAEVVTETIDVNGIGESTEREARLSLGAGHIWMEESKPVKVSIEVLPDPELKTEPEERRG